MLRSVPVLCLTTKCSLSHQWWPINFLLFSYSSSSPNPFLANNETKPWEESFARKFILCATVWTFFFSKCNQVWKRAHCCRRWVWWARGWSYAWIRLVRPANSPGTWAAPRSTWCSSTGQSPASSLIACPHLNEKRTGVRYGFRNYIAIHQSPPSHVQPQ